MRPWHENKILDCKEGLISIPKNFRKFEPHPYVALGAPYKDNFGPWYLRIGVVKRLILAEKYLRSEDSNLCFLLFDAWRPITVQDFMFNHAVDQQCLLHGINRNDSRNETQLKSVVDKVSKFWASPSLNPSTPPPHSTGGAVDLTLAYKDGKQLDMGGQIDEIGEISEPDYFSQYDQFDNQLFAFRSHSRRCLLAQSMNRAGFIQHPNEWWHFSYGDQMWAWANNVSSAIYGACVGESKFITD